METKSLKILFIGDIFGDSGIEALEQNLGTVVEDFQPDFIIANGENAAQGKGLTPEVTEKLFNFNINVITTGNHIWDNWKSPPLLAKNHNILRPLNYPPGNAGLGYNVFQTNRGITIGVLNLQGRSFMSTIDCPFRAANKALVDLSHKAKVIVVDFHAEATAEKLALARFLDGRVSAVIGTHTHIQTSDERIFPQGTAYITDVGMTGPYDSVVGLKYEVALKRLLMQIPVKFEPATSDPHFAAVVIEIEPETGKALSIQRIFTPPFPTNTPSKQ